MQSKRLISMKCTGFHLLRIIPTVHNCVFRQADIYIGYGKHHKLQNISNRVWNRKIAENCHLDVTTLSRTLDRLAEKGLLERRINPQSRRECQIFLTEEGRETAAEVCSCFRETEKKMCSGLTEKELKALDAGICRMLENLTEA